MWKRDFWECRFNSNYCVFNGMDFFMWMFYSNCNGTRILLHIFQNNMVYHMVLSLVNYWYAKTLKQFIRSRQIIIYYDHLTDFILIVFFILNGFFDFSLDIYTTTFLCLFFWSKYSDWKKRIIAKPIYGRIHLIWSSFFKFDFFKMQTCFFEKADATQSLILFINITFVQWLHRQFTENHI